MPENGTDSQESMLPRLRARLAMSLARPEVAAAAAGLNARIRFETEAGACDILVKDGVGTAQWGVRGANGVILIRTKGS